MTDHQNSSAATEQEYLEDNIATVAHHLGQPGAFISVHYDGGPKLLVDPGEVLKEVSRRLSAPAQPPASASDDRKTITIPHGYEDVRDADGRATGEVRKIPTDAQPVGMREALERIAAIENKDFGPDWEEIEEAREIARAALSQPSPAATVEPVLSGLQEDLILMSFHNAPAATVEERQVSCAPGGQPYAKAHECSSAGSGPVAWRYMTANGRWAFLDQSWQPTDPHIYDHLEPVFAAHPAKAEREALARIAYSDAQNGQDAMKMRDIATAIIYPDKAHIYDRPSLNEPQPTQDGVSVDAANKAIEFCEWLSGYIGHGPAVQISSDQMDYIRSKVHPLMVDLGVIRPSPPLTRPQCGPTASSPAGSAPAQRIPE